MKCFLLSLRIFIWASPVCVCVCVYLSTITWSMSKLWGGGVTTSDSDPSSPGIHFYCFTQMISTAPPVSTACLGRSFACSFLPPPPSVAIHHQSPQSFSLANHLLSWCKAPPTWTSLIPATLQPPLLFSAPRAACLCLTPLPWMCAPPLCHP